MVMTFAFLNGLTMFVRERERRRVRKRERRRERRIERRRDRERHFEFGLGALSLAIAHRRVVCSWSLFDDEHFNGCRQQVRAQSAVDSI